MNIVKLLNCCIVILLFIFIALLVSTPVFAQNTILPGGGCGEGSTPESCKQYRGDYNLNDFARLAVRVSDIILGVTGSLALLAFVYGGVMFLISAGNRERVEKGKKAITGAVIGIVIVFTSYMIVGFVAKSLGIDDSARLFTSGQF